MKMYTINLQQRFLHHKFTTNCYETHLYQTYNKFTTNLQQTNKRVMLKLEVITELNWALGKTGSNAY